MKKILFLTLLKQTKIMIWIIVIGIIVFVVVKFLLDWNRQSSKLATQGGVKTKYSKLIELLQSNSSPKIFQSDLDTYLFGWVTPNADNRFRIMQTFEFVTIKWQFKGRIAMENKIVELSKEWKFPENANQQEMGEKVLTEMTEIFNNSEFGKY